MVNSMDLATLGRRHGTDKGGHSFKGVSYLDLYEQHFRTLRDRNLTLLEIGVLNGCSLRMWRDYFPNAQIVGVDIDPASRRHEGDRIRVYVGSQDDETMLAQIGRETGGLDLVIDDGSHLTPLTIATFQHLFPYVRSGGWYIIEDLANSYQDLSEPSKQWPGMHLNSPTTDRREQRSRLDSLFLSLIKSMDDRRDDCYVRTVQFHPMMCFIQRV